MSILEAAYKASEVPQDDLSPNMPSKGNRRNRDWAKVIGTIRKLEQQEKEAQTESMERIDKLTATLADWMERAHNAERECERIKLALKGILAASSHRFYVQ